MSIITQSPVNVSSPAYRFGVEDAQENAPFAPESIFIRRSDQILYAHGFEAVRGVSEATAQFTGSKLPQPVVVPHYRRDDREYVRRTDANIERIFKLAEARDKRMQVMLERTAAEFPWAEGDILILA